MSLYDLVNRAIPPKPWAEGENIPWEETGFSERMLREHLSTDHDAASRRPELIDEQVAWLHDEILASSPTRILDLGCGPGLYAVRLADLGHEVLGVDISPASLAYARQMAADRNANCTFIESDFRSFEPEGEFGLVMQIYGELNVFRRHEAAELIKKYAHALSPGGQMILEVDMPETTLRLGKTGPSWRTHERGLFSDNPHISLTESFWDEEQRVATSRYWVIEAGAHTVTRYAQSFAAYEADEYLSMFAAAGLSNARLISDYPGASKAAGEQRWMAVASR